MRFKEQGTRLTLHEHDDDDDIHLTPTCSGQTYDHLQTHKVQRLDSLNVSNEIINVSEPIHRYNYKHMNQ